MFIDSNQKMFFLASTSNPSNLSLPGTSYARDPRTQGSFEAFTACHLSLERIHMHHMVTSSRLHETQGVVANIC